MGRQLSAKGVGLGPTKPGPTLLSAGTAVAHGGIALGVDRIVAILCGESSIREVIAFPKTANAVDLMSGAPSPVDPQQLKELHLKI